tara:strand:- start:99673 stop:100245 length:573 start_codon:yes stop_codon:yes gene_type:complete
MVEIFQTFDLNILLWVHKNHNSIFDSFFPFITNKNNWITPIILLILFAAFKDNNRGKIVIVLLIITIGLTDSICAQILKPVFERIRPSHIDLEGLNLLVSKGGKWSMPSNHAANAFAIATILCYFYNKISTIMYSLSATISFSRVYIGVHYPGDVIVGSIIGYAIGWFILSLWAEYKIKQIKKGITWVHF